MKLCKFATRNEWQEAALDAICDVLSHDEHVSIGLSGGSTPKPIYEALAARILQDVHAHLVTIDERYVGIESPESNQHMIKEAFGSELADGRVTILSFDTQLGIPLSVSSFAKALELVLPLDLIVLGMGPDGHIASLFPHSDALQDTGTAVHATTEEFAVRDRLSVTMPVIMQAKKLLLLVAGSSKQEALTTLLEGDVDAESFPAKAILEHPDLTILFSEE